MSISLKEKPLNDYSKEEIISILRSYLKEQIELSYRKSLDEDNFTKPSWSEYQAYQLGFSKALNKINDFLPDQGK